MFVPYSDNIYIWLFFMSERPTLVTTYIHYCLSTIEYMCTLLYGLTVIASVGCSSRQKLTHPLIEEPPTVLRSP